MEKVTKEDIMTGLKDLGLSAKDTVMVHSSLSSFGWVERGAVTVVKALLEILGEEGTLVVPTFSHYLRSGEDLWDRESTPSLMGVISETVRTWPGAIRSSHAAHPISAIGPNAQLLCKLHKTGFGHDSPFKTLVDIGAYILLIGVGYNNCTIFHFLEVEADVPYRVLEERKATIIIDGKRYEDGSAWEYTRLEGAVNDFVPFGKLLERKGIANTTFIGKSKVILFNARDMFKLAKEVIEDEPLFLLREDTRDNWR